MILSWLKEFLPGTGRWQAQPDGGAVPHDAASYVGAAAPPPRFARFPSPFRGGINAVIASEARQSNSGGGTGWLRFARNDGLAAILTL
jgi:hypothetical protein